MTQSYHQMVQSWLEPARLDRIAHNHITQDDNGFEDCPACDRIDPWHMTDSYTNKALNIRIGGQA